MIKVAHIIAGLERGLQQDIVSNSIQQNIIDSIGGWYKTFLCTENDNTNLSKLELEFSYDFIVKNVSSCMKNKGIKWKKYELVTTRMSICYGK